MTRIKNLAHLELKRISLVIASCFAAGAALANPTGPTVVNGAAAVVQNGNLVQITNSPNAIINWQKFSIGASEITRFIQQSQASAVLNRVTGADPSVILGALQSNGRVFLINPSGILFGAGAQVDVAGLVATSLNLSNADFLANRLRFTEVPGAGSIVNQGTINTAAGGNVYLVGPAVTNSGIITSPKGEVVLAAGNSVELVDPGTPNLRVEITAPDNQGTNLGEIVAESGRIGIYAGLINNSGTIRADSVEATADGHIMLRATKAVTLEPASVISASGAKSGEIRVLADDAVQVAGRLDASAPKGGDGGFIETSAAKVKIADGAIITTAAPQGTAGTWLVDPTDYTIAASGGDMTGAQLSTNLGGGNVTIVSSGGATAGNGDINVNDAVSWSANTLTLTAARDININAVMTASGTSALALNPATTNGADGAVAGGTVKTAFSPNGGFAGRVDFPGRSGTGFLSINGVGYTVINSLGSPGSTTGLDLQGMNGNLSGNYALGADIDASATAGWPGGVGFVPVGPGPGYDPAKVFSGSFDGLGHTISGLVVKASTYSAPAAGFFGVAMNASWIRNVGMVGGDISGGVNVGALIGVNSGDFAAATVTNTFNTGTVSGPGQAIGGLVGFNYGNISNSYNTGSISGGDYLGGLVGEHLGAFGAAITNSFNTGTVTTTGGAMVGGLVGAAGGAIVNSYSTGSVSGGTYVGGLVGSNSASITSSYSAGHVTGTATVGGVAGYNGGSLASAYWDTQASGQASCYSGGSSGCTGLTTAQMQQQTNFTGFDFANTWAIQGVSYPTLRWVPQPAPPPPPPPPDNTWLGLLDSSWTTVGNWSLGHVPTVTETVVIPVVGGTTFVQISGGTFVVKSITSAELFKLTGAGTSVTLTSSGNFNAGLDLGAGTSLTSQGTLSLSSYTLGAGAKINLTQSGTGILTIAGLPYIVINSLGAPGSVTGLDLQGMSGNLSARYALGSDIDASATSSWNSGAGFVPVGDATNKFTGGFDGLGHTISGLTINRPSSDYVGLFGYADGGSTTIRNVGLENGMVSGNNGVGGLVGNNSSAITNSYFTGDVSGSSYVGGLVGQNSNAAISNSYSSGTVTGSGNVGGLVGFNYLGSIVNSYSSSAVTGTGEHVGGLVGINRGGSGISDSYATGGVSGGGNYVGGLVGSNGFPGSTSDAAPISNSYATGDVNGSGGYVGGLVGINSESPITNSYTTGDVTGVWEFVGGLVGGNSGSSITNSYSTGSVTRSGGYYPRGSDYDGGVGGLVGRNASGSPILNSYSTGKVAGNGVLVGGLVGRNIGSAITSSFSGGDVSGNGDSIGGLVGLNDSGPIANSYSSGSVSGYDSVGGLVGTNISATISNSYSTGSVSGGSWIGGLVGGLAGGTVSSSYNTGNVSGTRQVGGLVGVGWGTVTNSYNTANVTGDVELIGGLVGDAGGTISNSYSTGNVIALSSTGNVNGWSRLGGLVGRLLGSGNTATIVNSYSTGNVSGGASRIGGLVGEVFGTTSITNTYWNTDTSGMSICSGYGSAGGCAGLTTAQMKQQASFSGWDFSTVWSINERISFPYLRANEQIPHPFGVNNQVLNVPSLPGGSATLPANQVASNLSSTGQLPATVTTTTGTAGTSTTSAADSPGKVPSCGAKSKPFVACNP